jgi:hypothetical protein
VPNCDSHFNSSGHALHLHPSLIPAFGRWHKRPYESRLPCLNCAKMASRYFTQNSNHLKRFAARARRSAGSYGFGPLPADAKIGCVDMFDRSGADLVADAHDMRMVSGSVDCVVTVSALEHLRYPQKVPPGRALCQGGRAA